MKHNPVLANQLRSKADYHRRMADIYEAAWKAEISELNTNGTGDRKEKKVSSPSPQADTPKRRTAKVEDDPVNPSRDWLRDAIRTNPGLSPSQLRDVAKGCGLSYNASWPYTSLWKLKNNEELVEREGRYWMKTQLEELAKESQR